jgi:hypothetical protein
MPKKWWKQPVVIAALIAALGAIVVAVIQANSSKKSQPEAQHITQHTEGAKSPAIANTGGNVNTGKEETKSQ